MLPTHDDDMNDDHQHHGVSDAESPSSITAGQHQVMQQVMQQMGPEQRRLVESLSVTGMDQEMTIPHVAESSDNSRRDDLQIEIPATVSTGLDSPEELQHQQRAALRSLRESHSGFSRAFLKVKSRMDDLDAAYNTSIYEIYNEIDALGMELESFWVVYVNMLEKKNLLKDSCDKLNGVYEIEKIVNNHHDSESTASHPDENDEQDQDCSEKRPYGAIEKRDDDDFNHDVQDHNVDTKQSPEEEGQDDDDEEEEEEQSRPNKQSRPNSESTVQSHGQMAHSYPHPPPPEHYGRPPLNQHHATPWVNVNGQFYHHYHHYHHHHNSPTHYYYGAPTPPPHHFPPPVAPIHMQHHMPHMMAGRPPPPAITPLPPPPPTSSSPPSAGRDSDDEDAGQQDEHEEEQEREEVVSSSAVAATAASSSSTSGRRPVLRSKELTWECGPVCMPKQKPIPNKFQGDMDANKDVKLPEFKELCNYDSKRGDNLPDGLRFCVMCGHACQFNPGKDKRGSGMHHHHHPHHHNPQHQGHNGNGSEPIIPSQNKGVCTSCDTMVWVLLRGIHNGTEIKFCKGCKNFRPWAGFGEKGLATKCTRCRDRQREKYALQKEEKECPPIPKH